MELLESRAVRPRQARYQAALRPDMKYELIIKHFPAQVLLRQSNLPFGCPETVTIGIR